MEYWDYGTRLSTKPERIAFSRIYLETFNESRMKKTCDRMLNNK